MANIKISELNPLLTVEDADVLPIVDNAVTKKVTAAILRSYTQGNSVFLTGAQTVAGIKTFTSQIASSVATGTAPFSVASTTKVTNLNADLLDGLSSADFALSTRTLTAGTGLTGGGDLTANRTFAIDSTVATLTGTQTLTNKTITSPVINEILDSNGNEILGFTPIASATDYITIKNGIGVGVPLHISAAGSSTNTGLHLEPKGTGLVQISDGTDTTKGFRFRSSSSATGAITLIDAVSSAGRVITLPNATTTLVGTNTTDTLTNKSIAGDTNTLSNIGNASLTNSAITINGTSTSLGGSINVGTVTSVAALTLGTSGTDLTSSVATGTTTPVITLNVPTASASNRGALSSTDWSTFNGKQNAITLTTTGTSGAATLVGSTLNIPNYADTDTGITSLNGLTALTQTFAVGTSGTDFGISSATSTHTFNLPTASAANRGALSSADWTTFNNKQNALTNPITGTGTTNYLPKFTGSSALGDSQIFDNGSGVTINGTTVGEKFNVNGYIGLQNAGVQKWHFGVNASNALVFSRSGIDDRMVLDSDGQLGLGTTSPIQKFQMQGGQAIFASSNFNGTTTGGSVFIFSDNNNGGQIRTQKDGNQAWGYLALQALGGNLLVGTTTDAGYKLDVNGTARVSGTATFSAGITAGGTIVASQLQGSSASDQLKLILSADTSYNTVYNVDGINLFGAGQSYNIKFASGSPVFTLANSGAATFSSSVTATSGAFTTIISTTSNAGSSGQLQFLYATNANSRTWRLANDIDAYGDFAIQQSTTQTGSTFANKLIFSSTGAATFSGKVNIGNPVTTAVAVASTHKVEIVIGGTTYYLLATT